MKRVNKKELLTISIEAPEVGRSVKMTGFSQFVSKEIVDPEILPVFLSSVKQHTRLNTHHWHTVTLFSHSPVSLHAHCKQISVASVLYSRGFQLVSS